MTNSGSATRRLNVNRPISAADRDSELTVLADLCADPDPEVHALLTGKVFPRQARVINASEWLASFGRASDN